MAFTNIRQWKDSKSSPAAFCSLGVILKENRLPSGGLTKFANVLLHVANHLTKEEFAIMKLGLIASDRMQAKHADSVLYAADLLSFMCTRKFINKDNMNLLMELLLKIQRMDLYDTVYKYQQHQLELQPQFSSTQNQQKEVSADSFVTDQQCSNFSDTMDEDLDLPNSQNSESSMSDDDKISQLEKQKLSVESIKMDTKTIGDEIIFGQDL